MQRLYVRIYGLSISTTVILLIILVFLWKYLAGWYLRTGLKQKRMAQLMLELAFLLWLAAVMHITVFSRSCGTTEIHWIPFYQIWEYLNGGPKELIRTLWMNILLFVPGGLLLEALWPKKWLRRGCIILTILILFVLSLGIEMIQYKYAIGCAEADDVLCNTLGTVLGVAIHEAVCTTLYKDTWVQ